jgi:hypothetical protein
VCIVNKIRKQQEVFTIFLGFPYFLFTFSEHHFSNKRFSYSSYHLCEYTSISHLCVNNQQSFLHLGSNNSLNIFSSIPKSCHIFNDSKSLLTRLLSDLQIHSLLKFQTPLPLLCFRCPWKFVGHALAFFINRRCLFPQPSLQMLSLFAGHITAFL